jgi:hypothetical protein
MGIKYDINGNAYRVREVLEDGTVLAFPLYEDPETGDTLEDDVEVVNGPLYDRAPREKKDAALIDLNAKIAAARAELSKLTTTIRTAETEGKARLAKLAQYDQLKRLEDFLDGKITHYVCATYEPPKIFPIEQAKAEQCDRDLRLLCLFGTTERSLVWKLNRYNDGSGCYRYVFPCCSIDEAKETAGKIFADHFAGKSVDGDKTFPRRDWLEAADKAGIYVPDEYRAAVLDREAKERAMKIKELEEKLAALRSQ